MLNKLFMIPVSGASNSFLIITPYNGYFECPKFDVPRFETPYI